VPHHAGGGLFHRRRAKGFAAADRMANLAFCRSIPGIPAAAIMEIRDSRWPFYWLDVA